MAEDPKPQNLKTVVGVAPVNIHRSSEKAPFVMLIAGEHSGMMLRIRSFVYLGSAFLVTCVLANLARFGIRDHRMGAAFLSLLGVGVVGFMVLFTARRAELMERYERVRAMMSTWEG